MGWGQFLCVRLIFLFELREHLNQVNFTRYATIAPVHLHFVITIIVVESARRRRMIESNYFDSYEGEPESAIDFGSWARHMSRHQPIGRVGSGGSTYRDHMWFVTARSLSSMAVIKTATMRLSGIIADRFFQHIGLCRGIKLFSYGWASFDSPVDYNPSQSVM